MEKVNNRFGDKDARQEFNPAAIREAFDTFERECSPAYLSETFAKFELALAELKNQAAAKTSIAPLLIPETQEFSSLDKSDAPIVAASLTEERKPVRQPSSGVYSQQAGSIPSPSAEREAPPRWERRRRESLGISYIFEWSELPRVLFGVTAACCLVFVFTLAYKFNALSFDLTQLGLDAYPQTASDFAAQAGKYAERGDWIAALEARRRATALEPQNAIRHYELAQDLMHLSRWAEAEQALREAVKLDSNNAAARSDLATVLIWLNRWDEALAEHRAAVQLEPNNARWHNNLGMTLRLMNRTEEARAEFREALRLEPSSRLYNDNLKSLDYDVQPWRVVDEMNGNLESQFHPD